MWILMRIRYLAALCGMLCLSLLVLFIAGTRTQPVFGSTHLLSNAPVWVLDAGHGGEDGGAVAADGTVESGINLDISLRLRALLLFLGGETRLIRDRDVSIYSPGASTLREKKVSDLHNRVDLVNETPNAVLVSIHQNCLPSSPRVRGAQVFYNTRDGGKALAAAVQSSLNSTVNSGNEKQEKAISDTIYLTKNVTAPAILIECGFLSNPAETAMLRQPEYQISLSAAIAAGITQAVTAEEGSQ